MINRRQLALVVSVAALLVAAVVSGCKTQGTVTFFNPPRSVTDPSVKITGLVEPSSARVVMKLNGRQVQAIDVDGGQFIFQSKLRPGVNKVTVLVGEMKGTTIFGEKTIEVTYVPKAPLDWTSPKLEAHIETAAVTATGKTTPGAEVTVNGKPAKVAADGSFTGSAEVPLGRSLVTVRVTAKGFSVNQDQRMITRQEPLAQFMASCKAVSPESLARNDGTYIDKRVRFTARVAKVPDASLTHDVVLASVLLADVINGPKSSWTGRVMIAVPPEGKYFAGEVIQVWATGRGPAQQDNASDSDTLAYYDARYVRQSK